VDVAPEKQTQEFTATYWDEIIRQEDYIINNEDIVLIGWGYGCYPSLSRYITDGGTCVVIIGEDEDGCTLPANFLCSMAMASPLAISKENNADCWEVEHHAVLGGANLITPDILTINTRYRN
jgi:hypothetical protein